ncbi:MAG: hypothetical protein C4525_07435 [Desulfarculus sp.]|nr:MAG: hypothetical protein C4525_07435 [Desulfarculus sp.]
MGPSAPESRGPWRPARARFLAGGRAQETPLALDLGAGWFTVRLLAEELRAAPERGQRPQRRWRLADQAGRVYELALDPGGGWRARAIGRG